MTNEEKQTICRRIAQRIRERRERLGMKQSELARKIGMGRPNLCQIETDPKSVPGLVTLIRIAKGLECSVADLVSEVDGGIR